MMNDITQKQILICFWKVNRQPRIHMTIDTTKKMKLIQSLIPKLPLEVGNVQLWQTLSPESMKAIMEKRISDDGKIPADGDQEEAPHGIMVSASFKTHLAGSTTLMVLLCAKAVPTII